MAISQAVLLTSCIGSGIQWDRPVERNALVSPGELRLVSKISDQRQAGVYEVVNPNSLDFFCERLGIRTIRDNPETYLEISEDVTFLYNVFVRSEETRTFDVRGNDLPTIKGHIRAMHSFFEDNKCRKADFSEFCRYAVLSEKEEETVNLLKRRFNVDRCEDVELPLAETDVWDLRRFGEISPRPFNYVNSYKRVILADSPASYEFANQLLDIDHGRTLPQFVHLPESCIDMTFWQRVNNQKC